jgi:hypothetical protein
MVIMTAEAWERAVGRPPENDDLERANCPDRGKAGHWSCGWDYHANLPIYMTGSDIYRKEQE